MKKLTFLTGALFSMLSLLSLLFKLMHWPGANLLIVISIAGFALFFIPFFAKYRYDK
jgi:hypothetical protein